jgi:hypothetical protein
MNIKPSHESLCNQLLLLLLLVVVYFCDRKSVCFSGYVLATPPCYQKLCDVASTTHTDGNQTRW